MEPFPSCQGTRGLKGNGRSATLGTESETRPPGQNILTLYFNILTLYFNLKYICMRNALLESEKYGLKGNGLPRTLTTESEIRPTGQNI